MKTGELQVE